MVNQTDSVTDLFSEPGNAATQATTSVCYLLSLLTGWRGIALTSKLTYIYTYVVLAFTTTRVRLPTAAPLCGLET